MEHLLETRHVVKRYQGHTALDDVSLSVPAGSIFGLMGPNGAGKTSLIRIINQITAPDSGKVFLGGAELQPAHIQDIGYLPEERGLYRKMQMGEQLIYLAQLKGLSRPEAIRRLKGWFEKFDLMKWWDKRVEDLSKGMAQKCQFIATIVHEPRLVILDEPFSGFDPINANLLKDEIMHLKQSGSTIIFSTHRMESVEELCDHVALINRSRLVLSGEKKAIKRQFSEQLYKLEYEGGPLRADGAFELLQQTPVADTPGRTLARLRAMPGSTANQLLAALLQQPVTVVAFQEDIPSFNDIFIKVVGETNAALQEA